MRIYQARLTAFDHNLRIISQPGVIKVPLAGVPGEENNLATVAQTFEDTGVRAYKGRAGEQTAMV